METTKRPRYWILDKSGYPQPCDDLLEWAKWFEEAGAKGQRQIGETIVGPYRVSTVFLGLDHSFSDKGEPVLFETMIFDAKTMRSVGPGKDGEYQMRCCRRSAAIQMHEDAVRVATIMRGGPWKRFWRSVVSLIG